MESVVLDAKNMMLAPTTSSTWPGDRDNNLWYSRSQSKTVVVFVHGIFSNSRTCWFHDDGNGSEVFWPDLVRDDPRLGSPSIYLGGYFTAVTAGDFRVAQCARQLLDALQRPDTLGYEPVLNSDELVFVCHSTGGIVVRYLLERHKELFKDKAIGLALMASPSLGSIWANVASLAARYYNQQLGLQLRVQGDTLQDIHGRFRDLVDRRASLMPRLFGMEAAENTMILRDSIPRWIRWVVPARFKIVPTLSAGQYFGEVRTIPGTDHFSIVKPNGLDHPSHEFLVTFFAGYRAAVGTAAAPEAPPASSSADPVAPSNAPAMDVAAPAEAEPMASPPEALTAGQSVAPEPPVATRERRDRAAAGDGTVDFDEAYQYALSQMYKVRQDAETFARGWLGRNREDYEAFKKTYDYALREMSKTRGDAETFAAEMFPKFKRPS